ncbi:hypothetical protein Aph02nite_51910 [Actinoplanes philippinensis]|nr:hypothetical protein Aph02nite_51910 [Actinoplanes philippinensis]
MAAAAALVVPDVTLPEVHDLTEGAYPGQLTEQAFNECCPASSESAQKQHLCHFGPPLLVSLW